jgi:uncharacterized lipoprotein YddW (UPF0748 family)
LKTLK